MTETIRYGPIGKEDLRIGTGTFEVTLADGSVVTLSEINLNILDGSTLAGLGAAGTAGRLKRVTDDVRGVWMDQGSQWFALNRKIVNVKEFGAKGDGTTDAGLVSAIIAALAGLPSEGGVLYFPPGDYRGDSSDFLVSISSRNDVTIRGAGRNATIIRNIGVGGGIEITDASGIENITIEDITLHGNNTGSHGIKATNTKDLDISRVNVNSWLNHQIYLTGAQTLTFKLRNSRITTPSGAGAGIRSFKADQGNSGYIIGTYFNNGKDVLVDLTGYDGVTGIANTFDGNGSTIGYQTDRELTSIGDWFDVTGNIVSTPYKQTANAKLTLIGPRANANPSDDFDDSGVNRQFVTHLGGQGVIGGVLRGRVLSPSQLTGNQTGYSPTGYKDSMIWRLSSDAERTIHGIKGGSAANPPIDGTTIYILNVGSFNIVLADQSATETTATFRIIAPMARDYVLSPNRGVLLFYDGTTTRWRIMGQARDDLATEASLDFPSTSAQTSSDLTVTVTGAELADLVSLGVPHAAVNANSSYTAWVSAADTVTVRFNNYSAAAIDPTAATFRIGVTKQR